MGLSETIHDAEDPHDRGDLCNTQLGEFRLLRRLGSGGMAEVYLAEQTTLNRSVAVKVLRTDPVSGTSAVLLKRFEQEARAAAGLNHSNIVQVFTTGRHGDVSYIVQEYVAGLNLSQWIRRHGCPDYATGLRWMQQIASALKVAGEAGVVHRDIKPENIMITRTGVAKVTDFGLAQLAQPTDRKMHLTQAGTTMGTPWYMSPEQIQGDKLDHRSDQYSFGVTCFHMFTGRPPYPGRNAMVVAMQHLKETPPPLGRQRADLPKQLCDVVHRMMSRKADDRFASAEELERALQKLTHVPVNHRLETGGSWRMRILRQLPTWRWMLTVAVAATAVGAVAARQLHQPVRLALAAQSRGTPQEKTAALQFAYAMLNPRYTDAWMAVIENFPGTPEADMARMRLALKYLNGPAPDYDRAMAEFRQTEAQGQGLSTEKRHLQMLGMIGQALTAWRKDPTNAEEINTYLEMAERVFEDRPNAEVEKERAMELAPLELKEFYESTQEDFLRRP